MTDWLTPDELERIEGVLEQTIPNEATRIIVSLMAHAAEADRRLAERDDVIRELAEALRATDIRHTDFCGTDACSGCFMDGMISAALARVDALTGGER